MNTSSVWKFFSRWYTTGKKTYRATGVYKNYLLVCWSIIYLRCRIMFFDLLCRLLFNLRIVIIRQVLWVFLLGVFCCCFLFVFVLCIVVSNTYFKCFFFCFVCLHLVSCVPDVDSFFGLSILDCTFGFSKVYLLKDGF